MKSLRFVAAILVVGALTACGSNDITGATTRRAPVSSPLHGDGTGYMGGGGRMAASVGASTAAARP